MYLSKLIVDTKLLPLAIFLALFSIEQPSKYNAVIAKFFYIYILLFFFFQKQSVHGYMLYAYIVTKNTIMIYKQIYMYSR